MKFQHDRERDPKKLAKPGPVGTVIPDVYYGSLYAQIIQEFIGEDAQVQQFYFNIGLMDSNRLYCNRSQPYTSYDGAVNAAKAMLEKLEGDKPDWKPNEPFKKYDLFPSAPSVQRFHPTTAG